MASDNKKLKYLEEHIYYEILMLTRTAERMVTINDQLDFNAFLESYAIHARILVEFFSNEKQSRNFKACDYNNKYRPAERSEIHGILSKLDEQIFHLAKNRKSNSTNKIDLERAAKLYRWIIEAISEFEKALGEPYRYVWISQAFSDLVKKPWPGDGMYGYTPSATNYFTTNTGVTSSIGDGNWHKLK